MVIMQMSEMSSGRKMQVNARLQFQATIDDSELHDVTKFTSLKGLLEGEAKNLIDGLSLTQENYNNAVSLLKERYGRKELVIFTHIQGLLQIEIDNSKRDNLSKLKSMMDQVNIHIRSLETLGIDGKDYGVILVPLILSRLPQIIINEWSRKSKGKEKDLKYLLDLCNEEIVIKEKTQIVKNSTQSGKTERRKQSYRDGQFYKQRHSTASALITVDNASKCIFCDSTKHDGTVCHFVKSMKLEEVKDRVKKSGACFKCLVRGHLAKNCEAVCKVCQGGHHHNICTKKDARNRDVGKPENKEQNHTLNVSCVASTSQEVLLQIATVQVVGKTSDDVASCNVLFDSGSNQTYIRKQIANQLRSKIVDKIQHSVTVFGGQKSRTSERCVREICLIDIWGNPHEIQAIETDDVCAPLVRPNIPRDLLKGITVADQPSGRINIDILIGLDHYWQFFGTQLIRLTDNIYGGSQYSFWKHC